VDGGDLREQEHQEATGERAPAADVMPSRRDRRGQRRRRRVWMLTGAAAVALLLVAAGVAVLVLRDDDGGGTAAASDPVRALRRAAATTTTIPADSTTTTTVAPGAGPALPAAGDPAAAEEPVPPSIPIDQGGAVVSLGSCRWDPTYEVLTAAGTLTNRSGDVAGIEVTVVWKDPAGTVLEEGFAMEVLEHGETVDWEAEMPLFVDEEQPPPAAVSCAVTVA
jgi:hypothetical protein